ncbi:MAG: histidine kinase [Clostridia bacterium]|nr:histidine kinase [Clostridia bacterium]
MKTIRKFIKKYRFNSILFGYFMRFFFIIFLIFGIIIIFVYNTSKENVLDDICIDSQYKSKLTKQISDNVFKEIEYISANIFVSRDFNLYMKNEESMIYIEALNGEISSMLSSYAAVSKYINSIYVYSVKNDFVCASSGGNNLKKFTDNTWYKHYDGMTEEIDIFPRYINNSYPFVITYMRKIKNLGAIIINIDLDKFNETIRSLAGNSAKIMIVTDDNEILYSTENDDMNTMVENGYLSDILLFKNGKGKITRYDKNTYAGSNMDSEYYDWKYITIINTKYMSERFSDIRYYIFLIFIAFLLVGFIISFLYGIVSSNVIFSLVDMIDNNDKINFGNLKENEIKYLSTRIINIMENNETLRNKLSEQFEKCDMYKMNALQQSINPHFINNTLSCINYDLVYKLGEEDGSVKSIVLLTRLIGYCYKEGFTVSTLSREVEFLKIYTELLKMRYGDFNFEINIKKEFYNLRLPRLFLQPFIENSVYYGIEERGVDGLIGLSCEREGEDIVIRIYDNGTGMTEEAIKNIYKSIEDEYFSGHSIGIRNSYCRLQLLYNKNTSIKIESDEKSYTEIVIKISDENNELICPL